MHSDLLFANKPFSISQSLYCKHPLGFEVHSSVDITVFEHLTCKQKFWQKYLPISLIEKKGFQMRFYGKGEELNEQL